MKGKVQVLYYIPPGIGHSKEISFTITLLPMLACSCSTPFHAKGAGAPECAETAAIWGVRCCCRARTGPAVLGGNFLGGLGGGAVAADHDAHRLHQAPLPQQLQARPERVHLPAATRTYLRLDAATHMP